MSSQKGKTNFLVCKIRGCILSFTLQFMMITTYVECRNKNCSFNDRMDQCIVWSDEVMNVYLKYTQMREADKKRKRQKKILVTLG